MSYFYRRDQLLKAAEWDESLHPRDDRGRFAPSEGGGIDSDKYAETRARDVSGRALTDDEAKAMERELRAHIDGPAPKMSPAQEVANRLERDWATTYHPDLEYSKALAAAADKERKAIVPVDSDKYAESDRSIPNALRNDPERFNFRRHASNMASLLARAAVGNAKAGKDYLRNLREGEQFYGALYASSVDKEARKLAASGKRYD